MVSTALLSTISRTYVSVFLLSLLQPLPLCIFLSMCVPLFLFIYMHLSRFLSLLHTHSPLRSLSHRHVPTQDRNIRQTHNTSDSIFLHAAQKRCEALVGDQLWILLPATGGSCVCSWVVRSTVRCNHEVSSGEKRRKGIEWKGTVKRKIKRKRKWRI